MVRAVWLAVIHEEYDVDAHEDENNEVVNAAILAMVWSVIS